jgi:hypothetical protein
MNLAVVGLGWAGTMTPASMDSRRYDEGFRR